MSAFQTVLMQSSNMTWQQDIFHMRNGSEIPMKDQLQVLFNVIGITVNTTRELPIVLR